MASIHRRMKRQRSSSEEEANTSFRESSTSSSSRSRTNRSISQIRQYKGTIRRHLVDPSPHQSVQMSDYTNGSSVVNLKAIPTSCKKYYGHYNGLSSSLTGEPKEQMLPVLTDVLPDAILSTIFYGGYLDSLTAIKVSSQVCKLIRALGNTAVKTLDLRKCLELEPNHVMSIAHRFECIKSLDLSYCTQFSDEHLLSLISAKKSLVSLRLRGSKVTDNGILSFFASQANTLKELDLSAISKEGSMQVGDQSVTVIASACPNLRILLLGYCSRVTDASTAIIRKKLLHLSELDLSLCHISNESSHLLSEMIHTSSLRKLNLSATNIEDEGLQVIASSSSVGAHVYNRRPLYLPPKLPPFCKLRDDIFSPPNVVPDSRLNSQQQIQHYQHNVQPQQLFGSTVSNHHDTTHFETYHAKWNLPADDRVLYNCHSQQYHPSQYNGCSCPLEELRVRHVHSLSPRTVEILAVNAPNLKVLDVSYCGEFTDVRNPFWKTVEKELKRNGTVIVNDSKRP